MGELFIFRGVAEEYLHDTPALKAHYNTGNKGECTASNLRPQTQKNAAPPSTLMDWPTIALDKSEQRKSAACAISIAVCPRPCRIEFRKPFNCSSGLTFNLLASVLPSSLLISVSVTGPGQMAFTRTPFRAASAAITRVSPSRPALAAAYAEPQPNADFAERLEIFRITPEFRAYIPGSANLLSTNAARRCTLITFSNSSSGYSSTGTTGP